MNKFANYDHKSRFEMGDQTKFRFSIVQTQWNGIIRGEKWQITLQCTSRVCIFFYEMCALLFILFPFKWAKHTKVEIEIHKERQKE